MSLGTFNGMDQFVLGLKLQLSEALGEMGHKIRSRKAPFANLANIIFQRELVKILCLYYPAVDSSIDTPDPDYLDLSNTENISSPAADTSSNIGQFGDSAKFMQKHYVKKNQPHTDPELSRDLSAICTFLHIDYNSFLENATPFKQWGKLRLTPQNVLGSQLSTKKGRLSRRSEWFEVSLSCAFCLLFNIKVSSVKSGKKYTTELCIFIKCIFWSSSCILSDQNRFKNTVFSGLHST